MRRASSARECCDRDIKEDRAHTEDDDVGRTAHARSLLGFTSRNKIKYGNINLNKLVQTGRYFNRGGGHRWRKSTVVIIIILFYYYRPPPPPPFSINLETHTFRTCCLSRVTIKTFDFTPTASTVSYLSLAAPRTVLQNVALTYYFHGGRWSLISRPVCPRYRRLPQ